MPKPKSRQERWNDITANIESHLTTLKAIRDTVISDFEELRELQSEFSDWRDNLPENLQNSALGEKLNAVADMDLEPDEDDLDAMETALDEAQGADLPLGFGRD